MSSSKLRPDAKAWTPVAVVQSGSSATDDHAPTVGGGATTPPPNPSAVQPHNLVYMYDENGEGELVEHDGEFGFDRDGDESAAGGDGGAEYATGGHVDTLGLDAAAYHGGAFGAPMMMPMMMPGMGPGAMVPGMGPGALSPEQYQEELSRMMREQIQRQLDEKAAREQRLEERRLAAAAGGDATDRSQAAPSVASEVRATPAEKFSGKPMPPLTVNGNHRWKKPTRAQQRQDQAQKAAFESFATALLHGTSPFMAQLREKCKASLPHIKLDQRFGKRGAPETAVMQFIVAPMVANYRPRHFHEITPGDLLEFHFDFSLVLKQLSTANCIAISYGPEWKPFSVPYCYVSCRDYKGEVLKLSRQEVPNSRSEAVYEDDIVKDITEIVLGIEELQALRSTSFLQAMSRRVNLCTLYEVFDDLFAPVGNYQIQIRDFARAPSTYLLKTSQQVIAKLPERIVLYDDPELWDSLPGVENQFQSGRGKVTAAEPAASLVAAPAAASPAQRLEAAAVPGSDYVANNAPGAVAPQPAKTTVQPQPQPQAQVPGSVAGREQPTKPSNPAASSRGISPSTVAVCAGLVAVTALSIAILRKRTK